VWRSGARSHHRRLDVDVERLVQYLLGHLVEGNSPEHSHVVDEEIQASQRLGGLLHEGHHLTWDTCVRRPRECSAPQAPDRLGLIEGPSAAFPVREGDVRPLDGQRTNDRTPQAPPPAGDHSLPIQQPWLTHGAEKTSGL